LGKNSFRGSQKGIWGGLTPKGLPYKGFIIRLLKAFPNLPPFGIGFKGILIPSSIWGGPFHSLLNVRRFSLLILY